jgi:hypothetical protein
MAAKGNGEKRSGKFRRSAIAAVILLTVYLGSYLVMSRIAFRQADRANAEGFYFFVPLTPGLKAANDSCFALYWPLVEIDKALGTGRPRGSDPILHLD